MKTRLLAVDLDGTLLTSTRTIPQGVLEAVAAAQAQGVLVTVATGRIWPSAEPYIRRVGADPPAILYNGGLVYDFRSGVILRRVTLPYDHARAVLERLTTFPQVQPLLYVDDQVYVGRANALSDYYRRKNGIPVVEVGDLLAFLPRDTMKILIVGTRTALDTVYDAIAALPLPIHFVFSEETYLEVLPPRNSKGAALKLIARTLQIPAAAIVAVGDNLNDLEMLEFAGVGVAMANADEALQRHADYVTRSNDEEGVRDVIERFILQKTDFERAPRTIRQRRRENA